MFMINFLKYFEHEVTDDCIDNHMFLVEHYQYDLNLCCAIIS
jgi:hypothetical protein